MSLEISKQQVAVTYRKDLHSNIYLNQYTLLSFIIYQQQKADVGIPVSLIRSLSSVRLPTPTKPLYPSTLTSGSRKPEYLFLT